MTAGISITDFKQRFKKDIFDVYAEPINKYVGLGYMEEQGDRIRLSDKGLDVSNYILADFLLTS